MFRRYPLFLFLPWLRFLLLPLPSARSRSSLAGTDEECGVGDEFVFDDAMIVDVDADLVSSAAAADIRLQGTTDARAEVSKGPAAGARKEVSKGPAAKTADIRLQNSSAAGAHAEVSKGPAAAAADQKDTGDAVCSNEEGTKANITLKFISLEDCGGAML